MTIDSRNRVSLRVNGADYGGWMSVEITAGIERAARDFRLTITDRWPGADHLVQRVKPFSRCELWIGKDKILTGNVDAIPVSYDDSQVSVSIVGRSATADLVDCAAINEPGQWRNQPLESIATALAGAYGIQVMVKDVDTGGIIPDHQIRQGETAFESLDRLLKLRQVLATDDAEGNLVLTAPGKLKTADSLELGKNILRADAGLDFREVFSQYRVKGQRAGTDEAFGPACSAVADEMDENIPRHRVMVVRQQGQSDGGNCSRRAAYERSRRLTKAMETTYTVQGWRQSNGDLWVQNRLVHVHDTLLRFSRDMLIAEVIYRLDENGTATQLRVGPPDGYQAEPPGLALEKKRKAAGIEINGIDQWINFAP